MNEEQTIRLLRLARRLDTVPPEHFDTARYAKAVRRGLVAAKGHSLSLLKETV